ncbi:MAG: hypothetical protein RBU23_13650 [Candidatus Auribacterota bacterium]|jgi:hypothetical protein|nr:hypothetical protein [Candidatus Auribacterota bacterium]
MTGQQEIRTGDEFRQDDVAILSRNDFLKFFHNNDPLILPPNTNIDFSKPDSIRLHGDLFELEFKIMEAAGQPLDMWEIARGTFSAWHRELSSSYENTYAILYYLEINFVLKRVFWRYMEENWFPRPFRPQVTIRDILTWANNWISLVNSFFSWVNEDMSQVPDNELALLVDDKNLVYKPKVDNNVEIIFHNNIIEIRKIDPDT